METITKTAAFSYIRVSTPDQQVDEQWKTIQQYADENDIEIICQYGDYRKRHKSHMAKSFQAMLKDIETIKPKVILVQRLDRFGTASNKELGYFLTILDKHGVRLITAIDGKDRSKDNLATDIENVIAASQSKQEQIDKAERVLTGKRGKASKGEYIGGKTLVYGFDVVCIGRDENEKWRMVEDAADCRIKYIRNDDGDYIEVERYSNEIIKDASGIMPDTEKRHRPTKDSSDRLYYRPSIRQERVDTVRRMCEWYNSGWTTYRIAKQLNAEDIKPVYSSEWYSSVIDGLLDNPLLIGRPAWNRSSQSSFRHIKDGKIVETDDEMKDTWRPNESSEWFQPGDEIFEPVIPLEMYICIQDKLEVRKQSTGQRSPRSDELWFSGLWECEETELKLAGNSQGKCLRVNRPGHTHRKLSFKEAEWFISEYLDQIGQRLDTLGEAAETKKLLESLSKEGWMTELRLEYIILQIQDYLAGKLEDGYNEVGKAQIVLDYDDERSPCINILTDHGYLDVYCEMVKDDMEAQQEAVVKKMQERKRLAVELMEMKDKSPVIVETYNERIELLSQEIAAATSPPDFQEWWDTTRQELEVLRESQQRVREAIEQGELIDKATAIRSLVDRIVCHWGEAPTTDRRHKNGIRTFCQAVTIHSTAAVKDEQGETAPIMTIETSSRWSSQSHDLVRWVLEHPRQFVRRLMTVTIRAA